jgi:hypothetical protein
MMMGRRLPETCRTLIPIKLEFSASVGFIHKESVTLHGHTIVKFPLWAFVACSRMNFTFYLYWYLSFAQVLPLTSIVMSVLAEEKQKPYHIERL